MRKPAEIPAFSFVGTWTKYQVYAREGSDWPSLFSSGEDWLSGMEFSFVATKERLLKEMSPKLKKKREGEENMKGTKDKGKKGKGETDVGYEFSK